MSLYREYVNPHLGEMLEYLNMDKTYTTGEGLYLIDKDGKRYLDFIASYGALPFGFNDTDIWDAIKSVQHTMEPSFAQPSALAAAGELAQALIAAAPSGLRYVTFANSGAEAVEASIKMARSTTGKLGIISTKNSFHGKTMGALSATGKESYQKVFGAPIPGFYMIPYGDTDALERLLSEKSDEIAAFIIEPIQGEGGIIIPPPGYLKKAYDICKKFGVLYIADEIQTGLGRTGKLFALEYDGITPDMLLIAKAIGGGLLPIGACLSTEDAYNEDFAMKHSSTFAGNTLACRVGLAALKKISSPTLLDNVNVRSEQLLKGLHEIQKRYPNVIREIRGKGLMIGIDFETDKYKLPLGFLNIMADQEVLTPMIASYLLNIEGLRVAPTLNGSSVIRIEPALIVNEEQCDFALAAIERVAELLSRGNAAAFVGHLIGRCDEEVLSSSNYSRPRQKLDMPKDDEGRFAFLVHPLDLENWREFDASLHVFNDEEILKLSELITAVVDPFVISEARITSPNCGSAFGQFIIIPMTTQALVDLPREEAVSVLTKAVGLAKSKGAKIVGLGAYTSVVSKGGNALTGLGVPLTTGNCFTVEAAIQATLTASSRLGVDLGGATACIVGATGSIGRALSILLGEKVKRLLLVGNPKSPESSKRRMIGVIADLCAHLAGITDIETADPSLRKRIQWLRSQPGFPVDAKTKDDFADFAANLEANGDFVKATTELAPALAAADIVVTATSNVTTLVTPEMLKTGAVVCDMSVPPDVSVEVKEKRPDVMVIEGGVIALPGKPDLGWDFGFETGEAYACMSETIMLSMEHRYEDIGLGLDLPVATILEMREYARKHNFTLAGFKSFGRPLPEDAWSRVRTAILEREESDKLGASVAL